MSNPVEGLLKVYEDMVEVLLVLVRSVMTKDWFHGLAILLSAKPCCRLL